MSVDLRLSLIVGLRNNLVYTKAFYESVRTFYQSVEIVFVSYGSTDGTHDWLQTLDDKYVRFFISNESKTLSDTYNKGVELATSKLVCYMHNDMILGEGFVEQLLLSWEKRGVLFYTVIEPPIFVEDEQGWKIIRDFGDDLKSFNQSGFNAFVQQRISDPSFKSYSTSEPFFFLCIERKVLLEMGGLDPLYNPMFCEDTDLLLRLRLLGMRMIQVPKAMAYHFVSKTSRFSEEFMERTRRIEECSVLNFYRKWGFAPNSHVAKRYDIAVVLENTNKVDLINIEPYVSYVYVDCDITEYISREQVNTKFDLNKRIRPISKLGKHDVLLLIDGETIDMVDLERMKHLSETINHAYFGKRSFFKDLFFDKRDFKLGGIRFKIKEPISNEMKLVNREIV